MGIIQNLLNRGDENINKKNNTLVLGIVLVLVLILALVTYLFFYDSNVYEDIDITSNELPALQDSTNTIPAITPTANETSIEDTNTQNQTPQESITTIIPAEKIIENTTSSTNTVGQLKYVIKPINKNISTCNVMRNGKWEVPQSCQKNIIESVQNLINTNKELIALEVSGIVDSSPYAEPSAELKQEGLASFRAREAIRIITKRFSNVAVFEGLSIQAPDKRGFEIKAYYLQK